MRARPIPISRDPIWEAIRLDALEQTSGEPVLASLVSASILKHDPLEAALGYHLANKLDSPAMPAMLVGEVIEQALADDPSIGRAVRADLRAVHERDSACCSATTPFLYFKGFHALQAYRVTHWLWQRGRRSLDRKSVV